MERYMQINIIYFASLKDASQKSNESIETTAKTIDELYNELDLRYGFPIKKEQLRAAHNETYVPFTTELATNDTVVFIPPVAGG